MFHNIQSLEQVAKSRSEPSGYEVTNVVAMDDRISASSLDEYLVNSFAQYAVQTESSKQSAMTALEGTNGLSPENLIKLQQHVLNYNIEVSLVGTLARKTVGAVETLLRS